MDQPFSHLFFVFLLFYASFTNVALGGGGRKLAAGENPFTPKASLVRYWNKQIGGELPKPSFLLSKASPMGAAESATFAKLAAQNALSDNLPAFCKSANLLCFPDLGQSLEKHGSHNDFTTYNNKNFSNYGTGAHSGTNSFDTYSEEDNIPLDRFARYGRDSVLSKDKFNNYGREGNVPDQGFSGYGVGAVGGSGDFKKYNEEVNVLNLQFSSYSDDSTGRNQRFNSYGNQSNAGQASFRSYGKSKHLNGAPNDFTSYGLNTNVQGTSFNGYGETSNAASDTFKSYGESGNVPENDFKNYAAGGNGATETFKNYRNQSNVGDDSFTSYAKDSNAAKVRFSNYGQTFNGGTDKFSGYGKGATYHKVGFQIYGVNNTFKDYAKEGISFTEYNQSMAAAVNGIHSANKWVEPGKFFRESMLKEGTVMPMPDIRDKMPQRSFLPRTISSKLPFSTSKLQEMKKIFHAGDNSSMERMFTEALEDCERAPSKGENKRCVASIEDMIDFTTTVLGRRITARATESVKGSKQDIMVGSVKGINGGKITKSVSCHQSLYPYLLYYCHSVPKVRVYEANLLDPKSKVKINHGVAICHLDTSDWSAGHGAFMALGSGPGKIEVCHWIFENDLTWTIAD